MAANPADVMAELQLIGLGSPRADALSPGDVTEDIVAPEELSNIISESRKKLGNIWKQMESVSKSVSSLLEQLDEADEIFGKLQEDIIGRESAD